MAILTPDTKAVVTKKIKDSSLALVALQQLLTSKDWDTEYAKNLLGLIEFNMGDISKQIGVPTETQAEVEERFALISAANTRIKDLERQLGESAQIDLVIQGIHLLEEKFRYWWRTQGFSHTSKFSIQSHGAKATLSGSLYGIHSSMFSQTPVSDKENRISWIHSLAGQGYVLSGIDKKDQGSVELIDCDKNRELITAFIVKETVASFQ